uniref:Uncharacterized protein n=1 Tax=Strigops habroptila TaxID=2489341 RepID=A0A672UYY5_STRHB
MGRGVRPAQNKRVPGLCSPPTAPTIVEALEAQRMEQVPALAVHPHGRVPASDPAEPSAMRLLRCVYLLLCSWCIRELLD